MPILPPQGFCLSRGNTGGNNMFSNLINSISLYALLGLVGGLLGMVSALVFRARRAPDISVGSVVVGTLYCMAGGLLGGKVLYAVVGALQGMGSFWRILTSGGLVYYGALIGMVGFIALYCFFFCKPVLQMIDLGMYGIPLFHAFGRVGCFVSGCCYGVEWPYGLTLVNPPLGLEHVRLFPVQLVEAACCLGIYALIVVYGRKSRPPGSLLGLYMLFYGMIRFIMEFFRGDDIRGFVGVLSTSQFISIFMVALGIFTLSIVQRRQRRSSSTETVH